MGGKCSYVKKPQIKLFLTAIKYRVNFMIVYAYLPGMFGGLGGIMPGGGGGACID